MRERLVRFRHLMRVLALLDRVAAIVRRVEDLAGELILHRLLAARSGVADQPSDGQGGTARRPNLNGHLVVRSADATALDLERRLYIINGFLEQLERNVLGAVFHLLESSVENTLGDLLLSLDYQRIDELVVQLSVVNRIRQDLALRNFSTSRHGCWF